MPTPDCKTNNRLFIWSASVLRFIMAFVVFFLSLGHVTFGLALKDLCWHFPNKNAAFCARGHEELLVGRNRNLSDTAGVSNTLVVVDALVVVPKLYDLVFAAADEVLSLISHGERVQLS